MRPVVVIGLGNPLMTDEGVGLRVIRALAADALAFPDADLVEAGTGGMALLHVIAGRRKAVFVDCALMGEPPGTLRRFAPGDVRSVKRLAGFSLHEGDLLAVIETARRIGECPAEVAIVGIEPVLVAPGEGLSPEIERRLPEYAAAVRCEIG